MTTHLRKKITTSAILYRLIGASQLDLFVLLLGTFFVIP